MRNEKIKWSCIIIIIFFTFKAKKKDSHLLSCVHNIYQHNKHWCALDSKSVLYLAQKKLKYIEGKMKKTMIIIIIHSHAFFLVMKNDTIICNLTLRLFIWVYFRYKKKAKHEKKEKRKVPPKKKHLWNYQKRLISLFFSLSTESFQTWWIYFFMRTKNEMLSRQDRRRKTQLTKKKECD